VDLRDSARFTSIFLASGFFCSQEFPQPARKPLTQAVGQIEYIRIAFHPNLEENMTSSGKSKKKTRISTLERNIPLAPKFSRRSGHIGCTYPIPMMKAANNDILFYIFWMVMRIFNRPVVLCSS